MFDTMRNDIEFLAYCGLGYLAVVALTRKIWCHVPFVEGLDPSCKTTKIPWRWTPYFGGDVPSTGDAPYKPPYKSDPNYHPPQYPPQQQPAPMPTPVPVPDTPTRPKPGPSHNNGGADFRMKCAPGSRTICIYPPANLQHTLSDTGRDCVEEFNYMCGKGVRNFCVDSDQIRIQCIGATV